MSRKQNGVSNEGILSTATADELLAQAIAHCDKFEYSTAIAFCKRALDVDPNHVRTLEKYFSVLLENGDLDLAKECLQKAIKICPDVGHVKYFSLAQLLEGFESLNLYKKGIENLKKEVEIQDNLETTSNSVDNAVAITSRDRTSLRRALSNAYCAIVELYMTDLCDEENAENECVIHVENAIVADEMNPEAYQCKASFLMVRNNTEEARQLINKSLSLWLPKTKELLESKTVAVAESCPLAYEPRVSCVKLLIDLQELESAADVLDSLIAEFDENVEAWYLYGLVNYLKETDEEAKTQAKIYLTKAKQLVEKFDSEEDTEMKEHIDEMLKELGGEQDDDEYVTEEEYEINSTSEEEMET